MTLLTPDAAREAQVVADTRRWLERAVIGLNLCPFAKSVYVKNQVHFVVDFGTEPEALLSTLEAELRALAQADPAERDTTLLVLPDALSDFLDFNDFLGWADEVLERLALDGELQIASFHPQFQFAGTRPDDISNCTNRGPYPTLHLLREASIDRAVEVFPEAELIYERNIETLERLGHEGWAALDVEAHRTTP
ncbi:DUF1415 domain-containing protein [Curvibacter sp. HBC61]|uniref:DUF1415 domain-containing protein n=1 Tax=Curvibacter cyanobacteriorum TaxID=3026422 RepID=A0ABT5MZ70_9BURK|nr:DUF1415 domain-containing protein [Curvibacter sp. HBC61]MDD0839180.1 DUF1415 domain-containing protein [Curvibacter sp. HBC61]